MRPHVILLPSEPVVRGTAQIEKLSGSHLWRMRKLVDQRLREESCQTDQSIACSATTEMTDSGPKDESDQLLSSSTTTEKMMDYRKKGQSDESDQWLPSSTTEKMDYETEDQSDPTTLQTVTQPSQSITSEVTSKRDKRHFSVEYEDFPFSLLIYSFLGLAIGLCLFYLIHSFKQLRERAAILF